MSSLAWAMVKKHEGGLAQTPNIFQDSSATKVFLKGCDSLQMMQAVNDGGDLPRVDSTRG